MNDIHFLKEALNQALLRRGFCFPNPAVGAVIVREGIILAKECHHAAGFTHAEIEALKKINYRAQDATIYVTLEPCCHTGKTPPCTDALIKAGIKRVVYGYKDPNPLVSGKGESILKAAGIECFQQELSEINLFYQSYTVWQQTQLPYVTAKIAITMDGKITSKQGLATSITGNKINELTHLSRKQHDAILTSVKTIMCDNPKLNVRIGADIISKPIYIIDSRLELPHNAEVFATAESITVFHGPEASVDQRQALNKLGVRCLPIDYENTGKKFLNLKQILAVIGKEGIHDLWVEAGSTLFNALIDNHLVDRAFIYVGLWCMGNGIAAFPKKWDCRDKKVSITPYGHDVLYEIIW